MKSPLLFAIALGFFGIAQANDITTPHVETLGTATIKVEPNVMRWSLSIDSAARELASVSAEHTATVKSVLKIIRSQGIDKSTLQTSNMTFGENYVYRDRTRVKEGYKANTQVAFTLKDIEDYGALWATLSQSKNVSINSVSYDHTDRIALRNDARIKALLSAKDKATNMAETLNMAVGDPIVISDHTPSVGSNARMNSISLADNEGASNAGIALGQIAITSQVTLVMSLVKP